MIPYVPRHLRDPEFEERRWIYYQEWLKQQEVLRGAPDNFGEEAPA